MPKLVQFILFFFIMLSVSSAGHWYLYVRLLRDHGFYRLKKKHMWIPALLVISPPLTQFLFRLYPAISLPAQVSLTWMAFALLAVLVLLAVDLLKLFTRLLNAVGIAVPGNFSLERRLFLQRGTLLSAGGLTGFGATEALSKPALKEVQVPLKRWTLEDLKIIQITDLHVGPSIRRDFVENVVNIALDAKPDLIALTGDFVDGSPEGLMEHMEPLRRLTAPLGVFFVTGNHESYSGVARWIPVFESLGFRVLRNEHTLLAKDGLPFYLAGVDDWGTPGSDSDNKADHEKALSGKAAGIPTILLSHQPKGFYEALPYGIDLQLSGHTHGGQIWPFGYIVPFIQPFVRGLHYRDEAAIYVSCGTGFWGPMVRLGSPSEVTLITVQRGLENA